MARNEKHRKDADPRSEQVNTRMTEDEYERFQRLAYYHGTSLGQLVRAWLDREWNLRKNDVIAMEQLRSRTNL